MTIASVGISTPAPSFSPPSKVAIMCQATATPYLLRPCPKLLWAPPKKMQKRSATQKKISLSRYVPFDPYFKGKFSLLPL